MNFQELKKAVFNKRPALEKIMAIHGKDSLFDYASSYCVNQNIVAPSLKNQFISEVSILVHEVYGKAKSKSVIQQLLKHYYVSTTDHMGPITHPAFVHSDLLTASSHVGDKTHTNIIVLASTNVSLGNSSLPRGFLFHTNKTPAFTYEKVSLFAKRDRSTPVFGFRSYTKADIEDAKQRLIKKLNEGVLKMGTVLERVHSTFEDIYLTEKVLGQKSYSDQIMLTNFELWKRFCSSDSKVTLPDLLYLNLETVILRLLVNYHLHTETLLHKLMFSPEMHKEIERLFDAIPCAFNFRKKEGTFLFWYLAEYTNERIALWPSGNRLCSADGRCVVDLQPDEIRSLIDSGRLIPSSMLSLITLAGYYGVKCLGGISQVNYLPQLLNAYRQLARVSTQRESQNFSTTLCSDFNIGSLRKYNGETAIATGLDFVLYNQSNSWNLFLNTSKSRTLEESFDLMVPEIHEFLYPNEQTYRSIETGVRKLDSEILFEG